MKFVSEADNLDLDQLNSLRTNAEFEKLYQAIIGSDEPLAVIPYDSNDEIIETVMLDDLDDYNCIAKDLEDKDGRWMGDLYEAVANGICCIAIKARTNVFLFTG